MERAAQIRLLAAAARRGEPGGLWEGLQHGVFSDLLVRPLPVPLRRPAGQAAPKGRTSFRWVPNGIPGVETRLPILFSEGVGKGRISLNDFVALTATNHAKTYGLYPKKGTIAVGFDADIAIWDPKRKETISPGDAAYGADYTPYEGIAVTGWPVSTMVRGKFVVRDGQLVGAGRRGHLCRAQKSSLAKPARRRSFHRLVYHSEETSLDHASHHRRPVHLQGAVLQSKAAPEDLRQVQERCCPTRSASSMCAGAGRPAGFRSATSISASDTRTTPAIRRPAKSSSIRAASARRKSCSPMAACTSPARWASSPAITS